MGLTGNEVSAVNQQRRSEELPKSPVGSVLESGISLAGSAVALGASVVAGRPAGLAITGSVVAGMGIVDWFRKLGTSKVNENLEALGQATEDALNRVENALRKHGTSIQEIQRRLESNEFKDAVASASLQALRTTQKERLRRLALILANGVKDNDLASESTDDMMRAAAELKDADIVLLGKIYGSQVSLLRRGPDPHSWFNEVQSCWHLFVQPSWNPLVTPGALNPSNHLIYRSSFSRLESHGLIQKFRETQTATVGLEPYALLAEGLKFYEHLQEIGSDR
jgi:DNA-binding transcriptional MerR regulator